MQYRYLNAQEVLEYNGVCPKARKVYFHIIQNVYNKHFNTEMRLLMKIDNVFKGQSDQKNAFILSFIGYFYIPSFEKKLKLRKALFCTELIYDDKLQDHIIGVMILNKYNKSFVYKRGITPYYFPANLEEAYKDSNLAIFHCFNEDKIIDIKDIFIKE
jgi:hypothetical protein